MHIQSQLPILAVFVFVLFAVIPVAPAVEDDLSAPYEALRQHFGNEYKVAREQFLAKPGAIKFLSNAVQRDEGDWLATALYARLNKPAHRAIFDEYTSLFPDHFKNSPNDIAAWFKYDPTLDEIRRDLLYNFPDGLDGNVKQKVPQFDIYIELALEMEWMIQNPDSRSLACRYNYMRGFLYDYPQDEIMFRSWVRMLLPQEDWAAAKFNCPFIAARLRNVIKTTSDPLALIMVGSILNDEASAKIMRKLAEDRSGMGTLAALLYAGRNSGRQFYRGHPFNGEWLEQWVKQCSKENVSAAKAIFKGYPDFFHMKNHSLSVPDIVMGLFLKYHRAEIPDEFDANYKIGIVSNRQTFVEDLTNYRSKDDPDGSKLKSAQFDVFTSVVWPKEAIAELEAIHTDDAVAKALIARALANVRNRTSDYPTGRQLQSWIDGIDAGPKNPFEQ